MPRPRSTGVKRVTRRRPDGSVARVDFYDAKTRAFLGNDEAKALAAVLAPPTRAAGPIVTFDQLAARYLGSPEFNALAPATQTLNRLYVELLRLRYGDLPPAAITRPVVRALRDAHQAQPTKGNRLIATLRRVLSYGIDIGAVKENAASRPGRLEERPRRQLYTDDQITRFLEAASPALARAMALLFYTAQRPADVLRLGPQHVSDRDGRAWISLRQAKTQELVHVPLHHAAAEILAQPLPPPTSRRAAAVLAPALLVPSPTGRPWHYRNFARAWDQARRRADWRLARELLAQGVPKDQIRARLLAGLQRRDLRRTAMVKMALAGATTPQIAAVSGHTIDRVQRILDVYIPRRGEVAAAAIDAWEAGQGRGQVVQMPAARSYGTGSGTTRRKANERPVTP
jgi:integrase